MASKILLEKVQKHLMQTGYDKKSPEDRAYENEKCLEKLAKVEKGNYYTGKEYLEY